MHLKKRILCGLKKPQALGFPFQWWADIPPEYHIFKSLQFAIQLSVWRVHLSSYSLSIGAVQLSLDFKQSLFFENMHCR